MFKEISTQQLIDELLERDGLQLIDEKVLADELIERNSDLSEYGTETLVEILRSRKNVECVENNRSSADVCVAVEYENIYMFSGKSIVLVVRD